MSGVEDAAHIGWNFAELGYEWESGGTAFADRHSFPDQLVFRARPEGRLQWLLLSGKPVFSPHLGLTGYFGSGTAVSAPDQNPALL
ncbi:MAG: hypothetical protein OSB69_06435 [Alphaproteobacteria bacterium]|nr:hypothetical protein [Alphaproteobacteria bacterium]